MNVWYELTCCKENNKKYIDFKIHKKSKIITNQSYRLTRTLQGDTQNNTL